MPSQNVDGLGSGSDMNFQDPVKVKRVSNGGDMETTVNEQQ